MRTEPRPGAPLVVVASEREGSGLVRRLGLRRDPELEFPGRAREAGAGLYRGEEVDLAITGVLEHNMSAATALTLQRLGREVSRVVNFGAAGAYSGRSEPGGLAVGDVVEVRRVYRFDVDDNLHWAPPVDLEPLGGGLPAVVCVTGSRMSRRSDRDSPYFPEEGQVEDMELYGLAVLLRALGTPLSSLKFVVNRVGTRGREELRRNLAGVRERAEEVLLERLAAPPDDDPPDDDPPDHAPPDDLPR